VTEARALDARVYGRRGIRAAAVRETRRIVDLFVDYSPCCCTLASCMRRALLSPRESRSCVRTTRTAATLVSECRSFALGESGAEIEESRRGKRDEKPREKAGTREWSRTLAIVRNRFRAALGMGWDINEI